MPKIPGVELAISSNEAFHLKKFPRRIMIVGGGYIGLEFAGVFAGLGAHVTLVHRGDEILRGFDDDVRHHVRVEMEQRGIHMVLRHTVASDRKERSRPCARACRTASRTRWTRSCSRPAGGRIQPIWASKRWASRSTREARLPSMKTPERPSRRFSQSAT
jgi:pyruvate/2-oxoglutarate dehydrogenase complex dihydrolipoamide dehydrogenase (E3) component